METFVDQIACTVSINLYFESAAHILIQTMNLIVFLLLTAVALHPNESASKSGAPSTPEQAQEIEAAAEVLRQSLVGAPRTTAARRVALLSVQNEGISEDVLGEVARWSAAPDHLLEAGVSTFCPLSDLIFTLYRNGQISPEQRRAVLKEVERRIDEGEKFMQNSQLQDDRQRFMQSSHFFV